MKRIIPLLLAFSMVVCLLAVPALADTQDTVGEARYLFAEPFSWLSIITDSGQPYLFVFDFACEESTLLEVFTEDYNGGTKFTFTVNFVSNALPAYPLRNHKIYCFTGSAVNTITLSEMSSRYLQGTYFFSTPLSTYAFNNSNELLNLSPYIYTNRHAVYFEGAVDFATYLDSISVKLDTANGFLDGIRNLLQNIWTEVSFLEMIYDRIGLFWDTVTTGFQNVGAWFTSLGNKISDGFDSVVSWFSTFYNKAVTSWQGILDKLDTIIESLTTSPDPSPPAGSDAVDDYIKNEEAVMDTVVDASGVVTTVISSVPGMLEQYIVGFLSVGAIFDLFIKVPLMQPLLQTSLAIGLFASLFGIVALGVSTYSHGRGKE